MNELPDRVARAFEVLDARAARAASAVDAERVAERVLARLRSGEVALATQPLRVRWHPTALRVAAAAVVVLAAAAVALGRLGVPGRARPADALPVVTAEGLSAADLGDVLSAVDSARAAGRLIAPAPVSVYDLSEEELRALLASLDSPMEKT